MTNLERDLARLLGEDALRRGLDAVRYEQDSTEMQGVRGHPDAVVVPSTIADVQALVGWCASRGVPIVPRGGGTGFAGGAVPVDGGVVCSLESVNAVRRFDPELWRMEVEAGVTTARVHATALKSGVLFPPNPGASEQSQIGGNIATNAGGPRSFKYGVTGTFVSGLEAVVREGELIRLGGPFRKDVAGYDLVRLLTGSEGTLGIIVSAWLKLVPAPEEVRAVIAAYPSVEKGVAALLGVPGSGLVPATLEFFDPGCVLACRSTLPVEIPQDTAFLVVSECDGSAREAERISGEVAEALGADAVCAVLRGGAELARLERWRAGIGYAVRAVRGGKMSEDVAVPLDRLLPLIEATIEIGDRHSLPACSWGHAGDGNVHATFMIDPESRAELGRAWLAADELFSRTLALGGTVSGEHGLGWVKRAQFGRQFGPLEQELQRGVKALFDPAGIFNPGKKVSGGDAGAPDPARAEE